jgi:hypothetical protein
VGVALIVSVLALGAILVRRVERRMSQSTSDVTEARLYALAAIEMGLLRIKNDPGWRNTYSNGVWEADVAVGNGTYTLEGIDPDDGILNNGDTHPLVLIGTGTIGLARQKLQAKFTSQTTPLSCLEVALHADGDLNFDRPTQLNCDQIISTNGSANESGSTINADVEAVGSINGTGYTGATTIGITPRGMPDPTAVFDHYTGEATAISIYSLPASMDGTVRYLRDIVLSPASNPYGGTDPEGIYKIDCQGVSLYIADCRIVGTLVVINPGTATGIFKPVNWEPAVDNYPSLLVNGAFLFKTLTGQLDEASRGVNFNPVGTPYQGAEDDLLDDVYPSEINGLVYIAGNAQDNSSFTTTTINGVLIVGGTLTLTPSSNKDPIYFNLTYDPNYHNNPPPGFQADPGMKIVPGSFRRVVD